MEGGRKGREKGRKGERGRGMREGRGEWNGFIKQSTSVVLHVVWRDLQLIRSWFNYQLKNLNTTPLVTLTIPNCLPVRMWFSLYNNNCSFSFM